jgi:hypothetical protein
VALFQAPEDPCSLRSTDRWLELNEFGFEQGLDRAEGFEDLVGNRSVNLDDGEGLDRLDS